MSGNVLQIVRGSEFGTTFVWRDAEGAAQDATGATVSAATRHPWSKVVSGISVVAGWTDEAAGLGVISMDETQTALLDCGALTELVITVVKPGVVTDIFVGATIEGL